MMGRKREELYSCGLLVGLVADVRSDLFRRAPGLPPYYTT